MPTFSYLKSSLLISALLLLTQVTVAVAAEITDHMEAGSQLFQSKMYKAAAVEFERETQVHPYDATAHYYLAVAHVHAGNAAKAYPHFQQAMGLSAPNSLVHQMASISINAYRTPQTSSSSSSTAGPVSTVGSGSYTASASAPAPPASSGPLVPTRSSNGGASAERDRAASYSQSSYPQASYPQSNFTPSNFSQAPQALYPQSFNNIPGYQTSNHWGANNTAAMWGAHQGQPAYYRGSGGITNYGSSYNNNYNNSAAGVSPTFAIYNSCRTAPITRDMTAADQALSMIKRQTDEHIQMASYGVHMELYDANTRSMINQMDAARNAQITRLLTPTWHSGRRAGYYSTASQADIDNVNNTTNRQIANLRDQTDRAENARQIQQATSESAANLSDLLRTQRLTGSGVMLRPEGTNLNVRNYETFHSDQDDRDAIVPMVARPMTLKEAEKSMPATPPPTVPTKHHSIDY